MFTVGIDLGQSQEYTAISIVERVGGVATPGPEYHLRYLDCPPLGTRYPATVALVLALLDRPPLSRATPLVIDKAAEHHQLMSEQGILDQEIRLTAEKVERGPTQVRRHG